MYTLHSMIAVVSDEHLVQSHQTAKDIHAISAIESGLGSMPTAVAKLQYDILDAELVRRLEVSGGLNHSTQKWQ